MRLTIDTVIFDLGGVLIDWNPEHLFSKIIKDEAERAYFLSRICTPDWNEEQDEGRPLQEATEEKVLEFPGYEHEIRAYYERWDEMVSGSIPGTVKILEQLKQVGSCRLLALTNWSAETFPYALENFDYLSWFEGIVVSGIEKIRKPDPAVYQLIIDRYNLMPERSLFIDDNLRNVRAAVKEGLHCLHFISPERLRSDLIQKGILES